MKQAFIFCGGNGTRFGLEEKPLLPLPGGNTILGRILSQLRKNGVRDIIIGMNVNIMKTACEILDLDGVTIVEIEDPEAPMITTLMKSESLIMQDVFPVFCADEVYPDIVVEKAVAAEVPTIFYIKSDRMVNSTNATCVISRAVIDCMEPWINNMDQLMLRYIASGGEYNVERLSLPVGIININDFASYMEAWK